MKASSLGGLETNIQMSTSTFLFTGPTPPRKTNKKNDDMMDLMHLMDMMQWMSHIFFWAKKTEFA